MKPVSTIPVKGSRDIIDTYSERVMTMLMSMVKI